MKVVKIPANEIVTYEVLVNLNKINVASHGRTNVFRREAKEKLL